MGNNTPTYIWNADDDSSWYYLWVNDSAGTRLQKWYTTAQAACHGSGICYATPDIALASGSAKWWIRTWNRSGDGPWSDGREFTVPAPLPPGKANLVSPSGTIPSKTPNYTWNADAYSTWYYLWVNDSTGTRLQKWYTAAQAGCPLGVGTCVAWPGNYLEQGPAKWWIQTWSPNGPGPWSDSMVFTVPYPVSGSMVDLGALERVVVRGSWSLGRRQRGCRKINQQCRDNHAFRWTEARRHGGPRHRGRIMVRG